MKLETFQNIMRVLATLACLVQALVYGPSIGLGITQGLILYCVWFNRERVS